MTDQMGADSDIRPDKTWKSFTPGRLVKLSLAGLIIYFLASTVFTNLSEISRYPFHIDFSLFFLSILTVLLYLTCQALIWVMILRNLNVKAPLPGTLRIFFLALFGKYVPGKVWVAAIRVMGFSEPDDDRKAVIGSIVLEHIYIILTGALFFAATWLSEASLVFGGQKPVFIAALLFAFLIALRPALIINSANMFLKKTGRDQIDGNIGTGDSVLYMASYMATWVLLSAGVWIMVRSITPVPVGLALKLGSAFGISLIAGFLTLIAPGGVGVREGIFAVLASTIFPSYIAVILAVCLRVVFTAAELAGAGIFFALSREGKSS